MAGVTIDGIGKNFGAVTVFRGVSLDIAEGEFPTLLWPFGCEEVGNDYGPLMAGATIIVAPLVIAFLVAQRWFVEGLSTGSMK